MRVFSLVIAATTLVATSLVFGSEIREFDIKTIERLGDELTRVSQTRGKGATTPVRKRAQRTAKAALHGKLFNLRYDYVVLSDPGGSGFLVYALGETGKPGDVVVCGHFRVTVSADGERVQRIDALSHSVIVENKNRDPSPQGYSRVAMVVSSIVSNKPVETFIYASNLLRLKMVIATPPKGQVWFIENGKITQSTSKK